LKSPLPKIIGFFNYNFQFKDLHGGAVALQFKDLGGKVQLGIKVARDFGW